MADKQCRRCGAAVEEGKALCAQCAASSVKAQESASSPTPGYVKGLVVLLTAILIAVAVDIVLRLNEAPQDKAQAADVSASVQAVLATVEPSVQPAKPTPVPVSERVIGTWVATRLETNAKKSKELLTDVVLSDQRSRLAFLADGTAYVTTGGIDGQEDVTKARPWYAEGEDVFIDYGGESVDGQIMFGRNRFYLKEESLYWVYTLDGKEVSDFVVYSRSESAAQASDPDPSSDAP